MTEARQRNMPLPLSSLPGVTLPSTSTLGQNLISREMIIKLEDCIMPKTSHRAMGKEDIMVYTWQASDHL